MSGPKITEENRVNMVNKLTQKLNRIIGEYTSLQSQKENIKKQWMDLLQFRPYLKLLYEVDGEKRELPLNCNLSVEQINNFMEALINPIERKIEDLEDEWKNLEEVIYE